MTSNEFDTTIERHAEFMNRMHPALKHILTTRVMPNLKETWYKENKFEIDDLVDEVFVFIASIAEKYKNTFSNKPFEIDGEKLHVQGNSDTLLVLTIIDDIIAALLMSQFVDKFIGKVPEEAKKSGIDEDLLLLVMLNGSAETLIKSVKDMSAQGNLRDMSITAKLVRDIIDHRTGKNNEKGNK